MRTVVYQSTSSMDQITSDIWSSVPGFPLKIFVYDREALRWLLVAGEEEFPTFGAAASRAQALAIANPKTEVRIFQKTADGEYLPLQSIFQRLFRRIEMTIELPDGIRLTGGPKRGRKQAVVVEQTGAVVAHVDIE